jgi:hypothetical protein
MTTDITVAHKACPVCLHPERDAIDRKLATGVSNRKVALEYGLVTTTTWRHARNHLPKAIVSAVVAAEGDRAGDLLAEVEGIAAQQQRLLDAAETNADYRAAISAGRELLRCVELTAKLRGDIATAPTINIVASPDFPKIVTLMMEFVDAYRRPELAERLAMMHPTRLIECDPAPVQT